MLTNILLTVIIVLIAGSAGFYIYRAKKSGAKCVGCPYGKACSKKSCGCSKDEIH